MSSQFSTDDDIISLWNTVRYPLLPKEFVTSVVICSQGFIPHISKCQSFLTADATYQYTLEGI